MIHVSTISRTAVHFCTDLVCLLLLFQDYTYWSDRSSFQSNPSNAVELAISSLFHVAFDNLPASVQSQVAGAEWWIQRRQGTRGISFHYDKDEGIASEHSWMKMPIFSTVT